jgi:hypothetical protein
LIEARNSVARATKLGSPDEVRRARNELATERILRRIRMDRAAGIELPAENVARINAELQSDTANEATA